MLYVQDPQFGNIVDYDYVRRRMHEVYDHVYPNYNMLACAHASTIIAGDDPNISITIGASALAYSIIVAAEEYEFAATLKDKIFTLGWTEEHCGSDLLSVRTRATKMSDDPADRQYHIQGQKWLINCSFHADYHVVVAKTDPNNDSPRSLSFFLVPRSSVVKWERLETHILSGMVLTKFDIDGPGTLLGKVGHGLSILQRMAMPSKYQCTYMGIAMLREALPASLKHLSTKNIFGEYPINFTNVFRQMYNLVLQSAFYNFMFYRAVVFNTDGFLQFHGTLLKSFMLLRINEILSKNLLVAGSKGFLKESVIGRDALDSFVLPVFDGHYTINTLMTSKHMDRYLAATETVDLEDRLQRLQDELYIETQHGEIENKALELRKPPFFNYVDYIRQFNLPIDLPAQALVERVQQLMAEIDEVGLSGDSDHRYKTGDLLHWMESVVAACEMWKMTGEDNYLNIIIMQYNGLVNNFNMVVAEGGFTTDFLTPLRQLPISGYDGTDAYSFMMRLHDVKALIRQQTTVG